MAFGATAPRPLRLGLDHAAAGSRPTRNGVPDQHGDDGADDGGHDRADVKGPIDGVRAEEGTGEKSTDQRADDSEHDVADDAHALVTADEETRQVPGDRAEHDPRDDAHSYLHPC